MKKEDMNNVTLTGYLAHDPVLNKTDNGKDVCNFILASKNRELTNYIEVTVFNNIAVNLIKYCHKDSAIGIIGTLCSEGFTTGTGERKYRTFVLANNTKYL